jgi:DNA-binding NtrC family response regulator
MASARVSVLVIDDEPALREVLSMRIEDWGYEVRAAADAEEAEAILEKHPADIVLSDLVLPGCSGLDLLRRLKRHDEGLPVIMMTAHGNIDAAVEAMKAGAVDFITKPLDADALRALLAVTGAEARERQQQSALQVRLAGSGGTSGLIGTSRSIRELTRMISLLASSDASGMITGESGTGKEVVARMVHSLSNRRAGPFVAVNAAAIPEGLIESEIFGHEQGAFTGATRARPGCFELADDGTLFLDELAEMPIALQPKLLRILEDSRARRIGGTRETSFNVRVLAATNRSPAAAVRDGLLREDLYYRLNVFELALPPLRERLDDIPLLTQHFINEFSARHQAPIEGIRAPVAEILRAHAWPGNVRELRNVIERAVIVARSGFIEPRHLPPYLQALKGGGAPTIMMPAGATMAEAERMLIMHTLERVDHNKAEAARQLGVDVKTIRNKLKQYERQGS